MIDRRVSDVGAAVEGVADGAVVLISGFGDAGNPTDLVHALIDQGARELTIVCNNAGNGHVGIAALLEAGHVRKVVCSFPRTAQSISRAVSSLYWRSSMVGRCCTSRNDRGSVS